MKIPIYIADAFTGNLFGGNPAAVCPLDAPLSEELMQKIAAENNLSETAFITPVEEGLNIRWFTPKVEVALCGHATLASAHILFTERNYSGDLIRFTSKSGLLSVQRKGEMLTLNFPADFSSETAPPPGLFEAIGKVPLRIYKGRTDYLLVFENQSDILSLKPDIGRLAAVECRGVICTATGNESDFVSRFFAPAAGVNEDPVTGSAHTTLTPYWSSVLNKTEMTAIQLSERRGHLICRIEGERVYISGKCVTYLRGEIEV